MELAELTERIERSGAFLEGVRREVAAVLVGQEPLVKRLLIGFLCDGHVLLEGVPGLGKSLAVSTLAQALGLNFHRIQFTPDLLPADILGTLVFQPRSGEFTVRKGPVFAELVLADEVNRAPPKVQSALLEAMQERQVSIGEETHPLPEPFLVLATQNPIEQEGTYRLPEAEVDRFLFKVRVDYPGWEEEREIMRRHGRTDSVRTARPAAQREDLLAARRVVDEVHVDERIHDYVLRIVVATRRPAEVDLAELSRWIQFGASPRASLALLLAAKAHAFLEGRAYVTPRDVKHLAPDVLRHRLVLSYEAEASERSSDELIVRILERVKVP